MDLWQAAISVIFLGAVWLAKGRGTALYVILGAGHLIASFPPAYATTQELLVYIIILDALICLGALFVWVKKGDMQAHGVGALGVLKNTLSIVVLSVPWLMSDMVWRGYAFLLDLGFVIQVLTAGGHCDAIGTWLDNRLLRLFPKRHGLLRDGG